MCSMLLNMFVLLFIRMEPGHEGNPGKHCETEMEVLERGMYQVSMRIILCILQERVNCSK